MSPRVPFRRGGPWRAQVVLPIFPGDGTTANLTETVPYVAYAEDNGTPGAGVDIFSLTVIYTDTPGLDQFDLFGSPATFAGTVVTGGVTIR